MSKLILIGIDGMDPELVIKWKSDLPNLSKLQMCRLESVFPPDSISAWVSIFTGLNPAQHGLLHSIDYLDSRVKHFSVDTSIFRGKTFWDYVGKAGQKVCVLNPFLAHPAWPVNGIMISGPVFIDGNSDVYPKSISRKYKIPPLGGIVDFPTRKKLREFYEQTEKYTLDLAEFGLKLIKDFDWDLYFLTFLTLDRIQHFFWRYYDKDDPTYPGENPYCNVIKDFYRVFDEIIGKFMSFLDRNTKLIIMSDHGHGRRSIKSLNLNEFLRKKGYLASSVKGVTFLRPRFWIEKIKTNYLKFSFVHEMDDLSIKFARYIPKRKALKKSTYITDFNNSLAWIEKDFSGMNPFGGISLNKEKIERENLDYVDVRNRIIVDIAHIEDPETGNKVVNWIAPREEIYQGQFIAKYPDIVFELNEEYGLGFSLYLPIISLNVTHKKISGGHKKTGVFFISDVKRTFFNKSLSVTDIVPTILNILNIKSDIKFMNKDFQKR